MKINIDHRKKVFIIGAGGLGKEVFCVLMEQWGWPDQHGIAFLEEDNFYKERQVLGINVLPLSTTETANSIIVIAIGESKARERIASLLPSTAEFAVIVDPTVSLNPFTKLSPGVIVLAQSFLSCDVEIGKFSVINPSVTISHDCAVGEFFTAAPGVNIGGNCILGNHVFLGANSSLRNAIRIGNDVTIGAGGVVTKDLIHQGTYIGNPARSIIQE